MVHAKAIKVYQANLQIVASLQKTAYFWKSKGSLRDIITYYLPPVLDSHIELVQTIRISYVSLQLLSSPEKKI